MNTQAECAFLSSNNLEEANNSFQKLVLKIRFKTDAPLGLSAFLKEISCIASVTESEDILMSEPPQFEYLLILKNQDQFQIRFMHQDDKWKISSLRKLEDPKK